MADEEGWLRFVFQDCERVAVQKAGLCGRALDAWIPGLLNLLMFRIFPAVSFQYDSSGSENRIVFR
jgi:hypothetical protein